MNDKGFKVAGHPRHKVSQMLEFGLLIKFPTFGSMVVHVDFRYYKYMYIEGKSAR